MCQIYRAEVIKKTLGVRAAAGYLRNRNFTLEQALVILLGKTSC